MVIAAFILGVLVGGGALYAYNRYQLKVGITEKEKAAAARKSGY